MKNQEVEDSQSKEADVSKKNFSQYLLLPTLCVDVPMFLQDRGVYSTQLVPQKSYYWDLYLQGLVKQSM